MCTSLLRQVPPGAQAAAVRSSGVCSTSSRGLDSDDLLPLGAYQAQGRSRATLSRRESSALFAGFARAANCPGLLAMEDLDHTHPAESSVSVSATETASQASSLFLYAEEGGLHAQAGNGPGRLAMEDFARSPDTEAQAPAMGRARQAAGPCAEDRCPHAEAAVSPGRLALEDMARSTRTKAATAPSAGQAASLFLGAERRQLQGLPPAARLSPGTEKPRWDGLPEEAEQPAAALSSSSAVTASAGEPNGATWPDQPAKAGDAFNSLQVRQLGAEGPCLGGSYRQRAPDGCFLSEVHTTAQMQQQQALLCRPPC